MADIDISLDFVMEDQEMSSWCWAAIAKSASVFYDPRSEFTQSSIVNDICGRTTRSGNWQHTDLPKRLSDTLKLTGNYVNHFQNTIEWREIRSEIESKRLLCARVRWQSGGGHFVVIYGVAQAEATQWLYIADPRYGPSFIPYEQFVHDYHSTGSCWSHTYFTDVKSPHILPGLCADSV